MSSGERCRSNIKNIPYRGKNKRILIVNVFFDDLYINGPNPNKVPQSMAPVYLAGAFSSVYCDICIYNEHYSGHLEDEILLSWPDMLVLTGLTVAFDRMLHLAAYARTKNPAVIIVAGGPAVRTLSGISQRIFDYACLGDIEQICDVIIDALGVRYLSEELIPRYDLVKHYAGLGYIETSRNCNFKCTFCSLTAEKNNYQKYDLGYIRKQVKAMGRRRHVVLIDNNFYGDNHNFFLARLDLLSELKEQGFFHGWSALVTSDFFAKDENLELARNAGCYSLFSGFESFETETLQQYNKRQNTIVPQIEIIKKCQDAGIVFTYGIMLDVSRRHIADIRSEIDFILTNPEITLPSYFSLTIPLLGTPYFYECVKNGTLLPNLHLRDLNGFTVTTRPLDSINDAAALVRDIVSVNGYRRKNLSKVLRFIYKNRRRLNATQVAILLTNIFLLCMPALINNPKGFYIRRPQRSYIGGNEIQDSAYTPVFNVDKKYQSYFKPTTITDAHCRLTGNILEELNSSSLLC